MATKKCPECAELVQREAKVCKHCGYRFDGPAELARLEAEKDVKKGGGGRFFLYIGGVAIFLWLVGALSGEEPKPQASTPAPKQDAAFLARQEKIQEATAAREKEVQCRQDISCYGGRATVSASSECATPIEQLAKNNYEWTDGWLDGKLDRYAWNDRDKGIVTFMGDKIKFQNGFGAWVIHTYKCIYDVPNRRVLEVTAWPGQLG